MAPQDIMNSTADVPADGAFDFKLYRYNPSLPAAIASVGVFAVLTAIHVWKIRRYRALYFTPFAVGGFCKCSLRNPGWSAPSSRADS